MSFEILPLFPSALYSSRLNRQITDEEYAYVKEQAQEVSKNYFNYTSCNKNVLDDEPMKSIKKFIKKHVDMYMENVICPKKDVKFYITQSWLNYTREGGSHHEHTHPNSIISGVFYFSCNSKVDSIVLSDRQHKTILIESKDGNLYNSTSFVVPVDPGMLLLFPSNIFHKVETLTEKHDRISLAFNTFVKGDLGEEKESTYLKL
jgi:uncharacterized protein (TIGR02466 family)